MLTLKDLEKFDVVDMERWLRQRLADHYSGDREKHTSSMSFVEFRVSRSDSMVDSLSAVFRKLSSEAQAVFQRAIASLLSHIPYGSIDKGAIQDLMMLVGTTGAYVAIPAFHAVLGAGDWGAKEPSLFRVALSTLKSLRKGPETRAAVRRLVTSANFPVHFPKPFIFDAYDVLIASDCSQWDDDLMDLSGPMHLLAADIQRRKDANELKAYDLRIGQMLRNLLTTTDGESLVKGLLRLLAKVDQIYPRHPADRLFSILFQGTEDKRILFEAGADQFALRTERLGMSLPLKGISNLGYAYLAQKNMRSQRHVIRIMLDESRERHKREDSARAEEGMDAAMVAAISMCVTLSIPGGADAG